MKAGYSREDFNDGTSDIFQVLDDLNIRFEIQEHKAIFSEEDSKDVEIRLKGTDVSINGGGSL